MLTFACDKVYNPEAVIMKLTTNDMVLCALFTALACAVSPISIPLPGGVPVTLQQVAVMLAGLILGPKLGALSMLVYLLLGAAGLPVFAGLTGGLAKIVGPTGGFLVAYPILAAICGGIYFKFGRHETGAKKYLVMAGGMLLGNIVLYIFGLGWFMYILGRSLPEAMTLCMIPFIPGDCLKMVVTGLLVPRLEQALAGIRVPA